MAWPTSWFHRFGGITPIHGNLHRSAIPTRPHHFDEIRDAGIEVVFSFEKAVDGSQFTDRGLDWRPHFWTDDVPPSREQVGRFLDDYRRVPADTRALLHCRAGWGRAGTAVTTALVAVHGWPAEQALSHFWSRVPQAEGHQRRNGQADFVRGFHASLKGRGISR